VTTDAYRAAWLSAIVVVACTRPAPVVEGSASSLRDACRLTNQRCTRCHTIDRVLQTRLDVTEWRSYIHRMRLMPGSGIPAVEEPILIRCLAYRSPTEIDLTLLTREAGR
jgi:hypothetical protein